jgi:hypothetical protein
MTDAEPTLDDVASMFPHWHLWRGVAGLVYARLPKSSPPAVVRAADPRGLAGAIRAEIARRSR